jgi:hypothetical protein
MKVTFNSDENNFIQISKTRIDQMRCSFKPSPPALLWKRLLTGFAANEGTCDAVSTVIFNPKAKPDILVNLQKGEPGAYENVYAHIKSAKDYQNNVEFNEVAREASTKGYEPLSSEEIKKMPEINDRIAEYKKENPSNDITIVKKNGKNYALIIARGNQIQAGLQDSRSNSDADARFALGKVLDQSYVAGTKVVSRKDAKIYIGSQSGYVTTTLMECPLPEEGGEGEIISVPAQKTTRVSVETGLSSEVSNPTVFETKKEIKTEAKPLAIEKVGSTPRYDVFATTLKPGTTKQGEIMVFLSKEGAIFTKTGDIIYNDMNKDGIPEYYKIGNEMKKYSEASPEVLLAYKNAVTTILKEAGR